jgi:uncharacterized repeat protein (TIGR01451 family)
VYNRPSVVSNPRAIADRFAKLKGEAMKTCFGLVNRSILTFTLLLLMLSLALPHGFAATSQSTGLPPGVGYHIGLEGAGKLGQQRATGFDPVFGMEGVLSPGALGLPGDSITWIITLSNGSPEPGTNIIVTDTFSDGLRIESVDSGGAESAISGQMVMAAVSSLEPNAVVQVRIETTILSTPPTGIIFNQALLTAGGSDGPVAKSASAEVFVPVGLPATGYPPAKELPGDGEPSVLAVAFMAFVLVIGTAGLVWVRGSR